MTEEYLELSARLTLVENRLSVIEKTSGIGEEEFCDQVGKEHIFKKGSEYCLCGREYKRIKTKEKVHL